MVSAFQIILILLITLSYFLPTVISCSGRHDGTAPSFCRTVLLSTTTVCQVASPHDFSQFAVPLSLRPTLVSDFPTGIPLYKQLLSVSRHSPALHILPRPAHVRSFHVFRWRLPFSYLLVIFNALSSVVPCAASDLFISSLVRRHFCFPYISTCATHIIDSPLFTPISTSARIN